MSAIRHLALEYRLRKLEKVVSGSMPKYFYHGTRADMLPYILENGLKSSKEVGYSVHGLTNSRKVYLTATINSAKKWAAMAHQSNFVILQIDSSYLNPDLLEGDYNALIDPFEDNEPDEEDIDRYANLRFDGDSILLDYEYAGNIPAKAISVVYQSDKDFLSEVQDHEKAGDYRWFVSNWDKYLNADCGTRDYRSLLCGAVREASGTPNTYGTNKKLTSIILSLPPKILNYTWKDRWGKQKSVLIELAGPGRCDEIGQLMSDMADKFVDTISDDNLELLWNLFTKPKQAKNIDVIINLPKRFLEIGKPYITQKIAKKLDL